MFVLYTHIYRFIERKHVFERLYGRFQPGLSGRRDLMKTAVQLNID